LLSQADKLASDTADQLSAASASPTKSLWTTGETISPQRERNAAHQRDGPLLELADSKEAKNAIFQLRIGELTRRFEPIAATSFCREVDPAGTQGSLEEVRDVSLAI